MGAINLLFINRISQFLLLLLHLMLFGHVGLSGENPSCCGWVASIFCFWLVVRQCVIFWLQFSVFTVKKAEPRKKYIWHVFRLILTCVQKTHKSKITIFGIACATPTLRPPNTLLSVVEQAYQRKPIFEVEIGWKILYRILYHQPSHFFHTFPVILASIHCKIRAVLSRDYSTVCFRESVNHYKNRLQFLWKGWSATDKKMCGWWAKSWPLTRPDVLCIALSRKASGITAFRLLPYLTMLYESIPNVATW